MLWLGGPATASGWRIARAGRGSATRGVHGRRAGDVSCRGWLMATQAEILTLRIGKVSSWKIGVLGPSQNSGVVVDEIIGGSLAPFRSLLMKRSISSYIEFAVGLAQCFVGPISLALGDQTGRPNMVYNHAGTTHASMTSRPVNKWDVASFRASRTCHWVGFGSSLAAF
jgi:hypothetical protein